MRPTTAAAGAAALLLAAGLAACSSDPEPGSPLPTGEPAPSATGSAEPTEASPSSTGAPSVSPSEQPVAAPTLPPEATTNDAAGAEAFTRHWFDALNFAYRTGDTSVVEMISSPDCEACGDIMDIVTETYDSGNRLDGGLYTLKEVVAPTPDGTGAVLLSVVWDQAPSAERTEEGEDVTTTDGVGNASASVILERVNSPAGWLMFGLAQ